MNDDENNNVTSIISARFGSDDERREAMEDTAPGEITPRQLAHHLLAEADEGNLQSVYMVGIRPDGTQFRLTAGPDVSTGVQCLKEIGFHLELLRSWVYGGEEL